VSFSMALLKLPVSERTALSIAHSAQWNWASKMQRSLSLVSHQRKIPQVEWPNDPMSSPSWEHQPAVSCSKWIDGVSLYMAEKCPMHSDFVKDSSTQSFRGSPCLVRKNTLPCTKEPPALRHAQRSGSPSVERDRTRISSSCRGLQNLATRAS
jgi:hypothetical protein